MQPGDRMTTRTRINRRTLIRRAGGVGAFMAVAPYVNPARSSETLVVNSYGGEFQEIVEAAVIRPFEKKFGVQVVHDTSGTSSQDYAKIRAARGAPGFDVAGVLSAPEVVLGAKEGLLDKLTEREVPNLKYSWEKTQGSLPPYGVVHTLQFDSLYYNKEKIDAPTSWADYWEPVKRYGDKIKGHVINYNPANMLSIYALLQAAKVGGGGPDNMDPAWALLKSQKPAVGVVVTTSAEAFPHFENGTVWISPYWSARAGYYISRGLPFGMVFPKEGVIGNIDSAAVPVGAKNKKLAYEFVNFWLDKETQRAFALAYFCSPARGDIDDWPKEFAASQVVRKDQIDLVNFPDQEMIGAKRREWTMRWQEIMS